MPGPKRQFTGPASVVDTACPLDCPDSCSLHVTVQNGRVTTIDGSHQNPPTGGFICAKVRRFDERLYGDARLLHPAVRTGPRGSGKFRRVDWDEALREIATRMVAIRDQWGAEAILPYSYGGSNGLLSQDTTDARLFRRFGTSQIARTLCAAPTGAAYQALYGKMPSVTYEDVAEASLIVLWGANPSDSGIHLVPYVRAAKGRGARLVVIDPRTTPLAAQADVHLPVHPGTDVVVALAVHRHLFETGSADDAFLTAHARGAGRLRERAAPWTFARAAEVARVDPEALARFADLYASSSPALVRCGWGLERNRNGAHAALAVLALPAVGGKFGVRGGGFAMSNSAAWDIAPTWRDQAPATRVFNMNRLGEILLTATDPPVQMLFVYNGNPVATAPDQGRIVEGLGRDDLFTVVFDQVMTDTALHADVLLPATTFLESYDVARGYGPLSLQLTRPVVEPVGESRSNVEVFGELCQRLDLLAPHEAAGEPETLLEVMSALPEAVRAGIERDGLAEPPCGFRPVQFVDVRPRTPDGKVDLYPSALEAETADGLYRYHPDPASDRYPLALISPASNRTISSTLGELARPDVRLLMHPADAESRHLSPGDLVRVFNELGAVECPVEIGPGIRPGTVSLPKGLWRKHTRNHWTGTALVPDSVTDVGGGACFNDARVEVARLEPSTGTLGVQSRG